MAKFDAYLKSTDSRSNNLAVEDIFTKAGGSMEKRNHSFGKFLMLWLGQFISSIGSGLTAFALGVYIFQTTGSAAAVSLTTLFAFFPTILLNPAGGVLADRFDRRLMMICGDLFSAIGLFYMLVCFRSGSLGPAQVYIGVAISAIFVALLEPAYKATITDLLDKDDFSKASGMMQLAASAKYLISPWLGGLLLMRVSLDIILIIDISTLALTVIIAAMVRKSLPVKKERREQLQFFRDMKEGWKAVAGKDGVLALVVLISAATFFLGFLQTLLSPMILSFSTSDVLGRVETISAAGLLLGSFIMGIKPIKRYVKTLSAGFVLTGLFIALLGASTRLMLITSAGFLFFCTLPFINTSADVMIRCSIPDELQGRAWGLIGILTQMGYILAYACAGLLADYVFNPMLEEGGILSGSVGKIIGVGPGRGIGFMLMLSGLLMLILGVFIGRIKLIRTLEPELGPDSAPSRPTM